MGSATDIANLPDGALARLAAGSPDETARRAEAVLCERFVPRVRAFGLRHLGDADRAQDLAQRVLLRVLRKLRAGEVRQPDRIASFVLGVARRTTQEVRREGAREDLLGEVLVPAEATPWPQPLARARLAECLGALADRDRTVVVLTWYDEQDAATIAEAIGTTPGNVRVLRHRAIARLRGCMGLAGGKP